MNREKQIEEMADTCVKETVGEGNDGSKEASYLAKYYIKKGAAWADANPRDEVLGLVVVLKNNIKWLIGCRHAAFSNMEGADGKEFAYWENWMFTCNTKLKENNEALAAFEDRIGER